jgi:hypothetical protein
MTWCLVKTQGQLNIYLHSLKHAMVLWRSRLVFGRYSVRTLNGLQPILSDIYRRLQSLYGKRNVIMERVMNASHEYLLSHHS